MGWTCLSLLSCKVGGWVGGRWVGGWVGGVGRMGECVARVGWDENSLEQSANRETARRPRFRRPVRVPARAPPHSHPHARALLTTSAPDFLPPLTTPPHHTTPHHTTPHHTTPHHTLIPRHTGRALRCARLQYRVQGHGRPSEVCALQQQSGGLPSE